MEVGGEARRHGVDAVDANAARQRADRLAVADVDPDVRAAAPHDQVARPGIAPAREMVCPVPPVEGARGPEAGKRPAVASAAERVDHEAGAVERARSDRAVPPVPAAM